MDNIENCSDCGKKFSFTERMFSKTNGLWICEDCAITQIQENDSKDKKLADLEAKLAEMTEKYNACQEARKLEAEFSQQDKKELTKQLAEKDAEVQSWKDGTMVVKLGKLEEQLAEKDAELNRYAELFGMKDKDFYVVEKNEYDKMVSGAKQFARETAITELEKVKVKLNEEINNASVLLDPIEYEDYHELLGVICGYKLSVDQIDQQIKLLKGDV